MLAGASGQGFIDNEADLPWDTLAKKKPEYPSEGSGINY